MEVFLLKLVKFFKSWQRRYFQLSDNSLIYYTDSSKSKQKGEYKIVSDSSCTDLSEYKGKSNIIVLQAAGVNKSEMIVLSAETHEDKLVWIAEINGKISKLRESINKKFEDLNK